MTEAELDQGMRIIREEAKKSKLSGEVIVTLSFNDGGLTKAKKQVISPLLPGARPPERRPGDPDNLGRNFG